MEALVKSKKLNVKQIFRWSDGECYIWTWETDIYHFQAYGNESLDQESFHIILEQPQVLRDMHLLYSHWSIV